MKAIEKIEFKTKDQLYKYMNIKLMGLISSEKDWLANLSNAAALFWMLFDDINWVGFYLSKEDHLILGPFQGKPACVHLQFARGVCGTAAAMKECLIVANVDEFPGHVACDSASRSEMVLPIVVDGVVVAVLDIDSPIYSRFDSEDAKGMERVIKTLTECIDWKKALA